MLAPGFACVNRLVLRSVELVRPSLTTIMGRCAATCSDVLSNRMMTPDAPQNRDVHAACEPRRLDGDAERARSLVFALQSVAQGAGYEINGDDLSAAMGLSWLTTAVPNEPDVSLWPMYARDAFLVDAGALFGLTIRELHPPEAARGLDRSAEFGQHFAASYRPLVLRALEHGQPVLAWQGFPGDRAMMWGMIGEACREGIGLRGSTHTSEGAEGLDLLEKPPVQIYVVEQVSPTVPPSGAVLGMALSNARVVLSGGLRRRFDVLTGPDAFEEWIERWGQAKQAPAPDGYLAGHVGLARSVMAGHRSGVRFLQGQLAKADAVRRPFLSQMSAACHGVVEALGAFAAEAGDGDLGRRDRANDALIHARDSAREMHRLVCSLA